ncbi:MAG: sugar ABC transporter permease [Microcella sp.]|uniref:carbohydrate ABC transporter permease n=1 Tax=Microcella sp. TaxID=1913979 RepID=UPI00271C9768|nr:sugar ABC transporter permease [Microcella sp.]MDO8338320.1 sugar ABC transporter permease [Microcella sp.]
MTTASTTTARPRRSRWTGGGWGIKIAPYLFLVPNMAIFAVFTIYPAFNGFNMSLYESNNGRTFRWVGLENYGRILTDVEFWNVARNTAVFAVGFVVLSTLIALVIAALVNAQRRGKTFFRAVFFIPVLVSPVVVGLIWNWMLERQNGLVNTGLGWLGTPPVPWLVNGTWAMVAIILVGMWMQVGFYMLILLAGLQSIDPALYEAARMDGANWWQQFRVITVPLLQPSIVVVVVLGTIHGFQSFDFIWTLTGGGPVGATTLMVQYIYENGFQSPIRYGVATAGGVLLFIAVFTLTIINWLISRRREAV